LKIQSASLDVPGVCPNKCKFCVSELWRKGKVDMLNNVFKFNSEDIDDWVRNAFTERLVYLRQKDVDTLVLTGTYSEPIFNKKYLGFFDKVNRSLGDNKFVNIEVQTSGVGLTPKKLVLLDSIGVKTISLSLASLDDDANFEIMQTQEKLKNFTILKVCQLIKNAGFNLRLSLNMNREGFEEHEFSASGEFWHKNYHNIFMDCQKLKADQVTFRKLYSTGEDGEVNGWIRSNRMTLYNPDWWKFLARYVKQFGRPLNRLPFGAMKYSIEGMSTVIDFDCMNKRSKKEGLKYLILRRNCRLYSEWDDPASLVF
jgi:molybdenum cofactor biosynthesis enzyme MoaA